jgi:hypothetical protein
MLASRPARDASMATTGAGSVPADTAVGR